MFKRVIWMGVGAAAGSIGTVWAERKVRAQIDKVAEKATVQHAANTARDKIVDVRDTVVAAVTEGRSTKASTEAELRRSVDERWGRERGIVRPTPLRPRGPRTDARAASPTDLRADSRTDRRPDSA